LGAAVTALAAAALCVRLGIWQLDRLAERRARNAEIAAARAAAPAVLPAPGLPPESLYQRRVVARGHYDPAYQRVWRPRMHQGTPGAAVLTPLRLADGSATATAIDPGTYPPPDSVVTVEGLALRAPRGPGDVDPRALADTVPYLLLPFVVQRPPDGGAGRLHPLPPPALDDGPHRSYAFQWFSFAIVVLVGTFFLLRREKKGCGA
jgi:surfeit locus 1 family protein